ncbi:uncharacterized protein LOC104870452 [Fukomys damarensis]|uniref:uncharacterized protein LOC104870452 n=1 Tax=Fukomys damarensis TaxID=885580 RepID=UPI0005402E59|nr:uncharacterized protein LOC104870452 [Fukomys damarensis]
MDKILSKWSGCALDPKALSDKFFETIGKNWIPDPTMTWLLHLYPKNSCLYWAPKIQYADVEMSIREGNTTLLSGCCPLHREIMNLTFDREEPNWMRGGIWSDWFPLSHFVNYLVHLMCHYPTIPVLPKMQEPDLYNSNRYREIWARQNDPYRLYKIITFPKSLEAYSLNSKIKSLYSKLLRDLRPIHLELIQSWDCCSADKYVPLTSPRTLQEVAVRQLFVNARQKAEIELEAQQN